MRNITEKAVAAFLAGEKFSLGNTCVEVRTDFTQDITHLVLHGNVIAIKYFATGKVEITTAGWNTATTKERLNGLPGVRLHTKAYQLYLNGKKWDGGWVTI